MFSAILVDKESIFPKIYTFNIVTRTVSNKSTLINTFQMPLVYRFIFIFLYTIHDKIRSNRTYSMLKPDSFELSCALRRPYKIPVTDK